MIYKRAKDVATDACEAQAGLDSPETDVDFIGSSSAGSKSLRDSDCNITVLKSDDDGHKPTNGFTLDGRD